jgi:hypothetical protein
MKRRSRTKPKLKRTIRDLQTLGEVLAATDPVAPELCPGQPPVITTNAPPEGGRESEGTK